AVANTPGRSISASCTAASTGTSARAADSNRSPFEDTRLTPLPSDAARRRAAGSSRFEDTRLTPLPSDAARRRAAGSSRFEDTRPPLPARHLTRRLPVHVLHLREPRVQFTMQAERLAQQVRGLLAVTLTIDHAPAVCR